MKKYLSGMKRYIWIVLVCTVLAAVVGLALLKIQKPFFQVSSTLIVVADSPSNGFDPALSSNDSIGLATDYASQIMSRSVMEYVYQFDPQIHLHGYVADDLLADVITTPSATTPTVTITASATNAADAALLANDVANGFQSYIQQLHQQQLDTQRTNLTNQLNAALAQKGKIEASLESVPSNTDPHFAVYQAELNDELHTIDTLQSQLITLPTAADSQIQAIQLATAGDAVPAVKRNLILELSAGIGILVGTLIMLLVIYLDDRIWSVEQVREKLQMAYLGGVSKNGKLGENPVLPGSRVIHELADICANLRLTGTLPDQRHAPQGAILLITSPRDAEGKTTIATALAMTMARGGCKVVIVDGNLRQPETHLAFGVRASEPGLANLLENKATVDNAVQRTIVPGLWLLSGGTPVNAPALLLEQKLPFVLEQLRKKADIIVLDGPSLLSGAEASILASMADGVAMVIDSRHDKLSLLQRAKEVLASVAHVPAGVILNRFQQKRHNSYYAFAYPRAMVVDGQKAVQAYAGNNGGAENGYRSVPAPVPQDASPLPPTQSSMWSTPEPPRPATWATPAKSSLLQYAESADSKTGGEPRKR